MTNVPTLKTYIKNGFNILLQGKHGVGKTEMLRQACAELELNVVYKSASTLDPFTDLVGIPVPTDVNGEQVLVNVRPHEIDQAQVLFFDELNRAEQKTLNAFFEIVQFHTINGEPLPNLQCVIAAQNPPDGDYSVNSLDPALVDRFHVVLDVDSKPSINYMKERFGDDIAAALYDWQNEHKAKAGYISPRRLCTIAEVFQKVPTREAVEAAMPPGGTFGFGALFDMLEAAVGNGGASAIDYGVAEPEYLRKSALPSALATWFEGATAEGRRHVVEALRSSSGQADRSVGVKTLADRFEPVLGKLNDEEWKLLVENWGDAKKSAMRARGHQIKTKNPALAEAILTALPYKSKS